MKPLLYLDVDGVLNAFKAVGWSQDLFDEALVFKSDSGHYMKRRVILDRRHPQLLGMLAADFDLVWATAWEDMANVLLAERLGLDQLPVVRFGGRRWDGSKLHWKTAKLFGYADGRPFCWIDDEATGYDVSWLRSRNPDTLIQVCDPAEGLGERQVLAALDFAGRLHQAQAQRPVTR